MSFDLLTFPHILYLGAVANYNPSKVYMTCKLKDSALRNEKFFGEAIGLTNGKTYEFHYVSYSPNRETKRKDILVTKDDNNKYIRYDDDRSIWVRNNLNQKYKK